MEFSMPTWYLKLSKTSHYQIHQSVTQFPVKTPTRSLSPFPEYEHTRELSVSHPRAPCLTVFLRLWVIFFLSLSDEGWKDGKKVFCGANGHFQIKNGESERWKIHRHGTEIARFAILGIEFDFLISQKLRRRARSGRSWVGDGDPDEKFAGKKTQTVEQRELSPAPFSSIHSTPNPTLRLSRWLRFLRFHPESLMIVTYCEVEWKLLMASVGRRTRR